MVRALFQPSTWPGWIAVMLAWSYRAIDFWGNADFFWENAWPLIRPILGAVEFQGVLTIFGLVWVIVASRKRAPLPPGKWWPRRINRPATQSYLSKRDLSVQDLIEGGNAGAPEVRNKIIEDCTITGPAVFALQGVSGIVGCDFGAVYIDSLFIVVVPSQKAVAGVIGLRDTIFRRCKMVNVSFIGSEANMAAMKAKFIGTAVVKEDR